MPGDNHRCSYLLLHELASVGVLPMRVAEQTRDLKRAESSGVTPRVQLDDEAKGALSGLAHTATLRIDGDVPLLTNPQTQVTWLFLSTGCHNTSKCSHAVTESAIMGSAREILRF